MPNFVYYYVYSPVTAYVRGLDNYCSSVGGGPHPVVGGSTRQIPAGSIRSVIGQYGSVFLWVWSD